MNAIPHRLTGSAGLTYVAHLACTETAPYRAGVAFLDAADRWRGFPSEETHPDPQSAYLALMQSILTRVASETPRGYIHFYPADPELAQRMRAQHYHDRAPEPALAGEAWEAVANALSTQRCGCSVLGGRGTSTGTLAALAILRGETARAEESEVDEREAQPGPADLELPF